MPWTSVRFPDGRVMSHQQVLTLDDLEAPDDWPILSVREDLVRQRPPEPSTYHVTELSMPRYSWFERNVGYTLDFDEVMDRWLGRVIHQGIQWKYPLREIAVTRPYEVEGEKVTLLGHVDAYDPKTKILWEFKTYATLKFLLERNQPEPDHIFQVQGYYELMLESLPGIVIQKLGLWYISKSAPPSPPSRSLPGLLRSHRFLLEPRFNPDMELRLRIFHRSLKDRVPPPKSLDPPWKEQFSPFGEAYIRETSEEKAHWQHALPEIQMREAVSRRLEKHGM